MFCYGPKSALLWTGKYGDICYGRSAHVDMDESSVDHSLWTNGIKWSLLKTKRQSTEIHNYENERLCSHNLKDNTIREYKVLDQSKITILSSTSLVTNRYDI